MSSGKVIGYIAYATKLQLICEGDSCIVAGSRKKMVSYLDIARPGASKIVAIAKARFGDIERAIELGAAYSFDREAYERFQPLARKSGIDVGPADFDAAESAGIQFVTVRRKVPSGD